MPLLSRSKNNQLLACLPDCVRQRWLPQLEWVFMPLGQVLYRSGQHLSYVYFPVTAMVTLICITADGSSSGIASIGYEGLVGVEAFMDGHSTLGDAVVQSEGYGFRLAAALVKKDFQANHATAQLMLGFTDTLMVQIAQLSICNRYHSVEQRLCSWLLWQLDHLNTCEIFSTHERIAGLLGVRRESISEGLCKLQKLGVIKHTRGYISSENRIGLEKQSCECANVIKLAYDRLPTGDMVERPRVFFSTAAATTMAAPVE
jgi:CRP-like cAMP-binding protein